MSLPNGDPAPSARRGGECGIGNDAEQVRAQEELNLVGQCFDALHLLCHNHSNSTAREPGVRLEEEPDGARLALDLSGLGKGELRQHLHALHRLIKVDSDGQRPHMCVYRYGFVCRGKLKKRKAASLEILATLESGRTMSWPTPVRS